MFETRPSSHQGDEPKRRKQLTAEELKAAPKPVPKKRGDATASVGAKTGSAGGASGSAAKKKKKKKATPTSPATGSRTEPASSASAAAVQQVALAPSASASAEGALPAPGEDEWFAPLSVPAQAANEVFRWLALGGGLLVLLGVLLPVVLVAGEQSTTVGFWSSTPTLILGSALLVFALGLCVLPFFAPANLRGVALAACSGGVALVLLAGGVAALIQAPGEMLTGGILALSLGFLVSLAGSCVVLAVALAALFATPSRGMRLVAGVGAALTLIGFVVPFSQAGSPLFVTTVGSLAVPFIPGVSVAGMHSFLAYGLLGLSLVCWLGVSVLGLFFLRGALANARLGWGIVGLGAASITLAVAATASLIVGLEQLVVALALIKSTVLLAGLQIALVVGFAALLASMRLDATMQPEQPQERAGPSEEFGPAWPRPAVAARFGMAAAVLVVASLVLALVGRIATPEPEENGAPNPLAAAFGGLASEGAAGGEGALPAVQPEPRDAAGSAQDREARELMQEVERLNALLSRAEQYIRNRDFRSAFDTARGASAPRSLPGYRRTFEEVARRANVSLAAERELEQAINALAEGDVDFARRALDGIDVDQTRHLRSRHRQIEDLANRIAVIHRAERPSQVLRLIEELQERVTLPEAIEAYLTRLFEEQYNELVNDWEARMEEWERQIRAGEIERVRERAARSSRASRNWLPDNLVERLERIEAVLAGEASSLAEEPEEPDETTEEVVEDPEEEEFDYMSAVLRALSRDRFDEALELLEEHGEEGDAALVTEIERVRDMAQRIEEEPLDAYVALGEFELGSAAPRILERWRVRQERIAARRAEAQLPETEYAPLYAIHEAAEAGEYERLLALAESADLSAFPETLRLRAELDIRRAHFETRVREGKASEYRWVELNTHDGRGETLWMLPSLLEQRPQLVYGQNERGVIQVLHWEELDSRVPYRLLEPEEAQQHAQERFEYLYERMFDRHIPQRRELDRAQRNLNRAERAVSRAESQRNRLQRDFENAMEFAEEHNERPFPDRVQRDLDRRARRLNDAAGELAEAQREVSQLQSEIRRLEGQVERAIEQMRASPPAEERWRIWRLATLGGDEGLANRMLDVLEEDLGSIDMMAQSYGLHLEPAWQRYQRAIARRNRSEAERAWREVARRHPFTPPIQPADRRSPMVRLILRDLRGELPSYAPLDMPEDTDFEEDPLEFDERALNVPGVSVRSPSLMESRIRENIDWLKSHLEANYQRTLGEQPSATPQHAEEVPLDDLMRHTLDGYWVLSHVLVTTGGTADLGPRHDAEELEAQSERRIADLAQRMPPWRQ